MPSGQPIVARSGQPAEGAVYSIARPLAWRAPLVVASPHSGHDYPAEFLAVTGLTLEELRLSEDCYVDELVGSAPAAGAPLLAALFPRSFCDVNREPLELDPGMFSDRLPQGANSSSPRVAAGLGVVPRLAAHEREIYRHKIAFAEAEARIAGYYRPYHQALRALCDEAVARFGCCLVLDCHSMPSAHVVPATAPAGTRGERGAMRAEPAAPAQVDFVLGDCFGASCAPAVTAAVDEMLRARGCSLRRNTPYSGGYVTQHYGRPATGIHVLQVEISRALYVDERSLERMPGFAGVQATMAALIAMLAERAGDLMKPGLPAS